MQSTFHKVLRHSQEYDFRARRLRHYEKNPMAWILHLFQELIWPVFAARIYLHVAGKW